MSIEEINIVPTSDFGEARDFVGKINKRVDTEEMKGMHLHMKTQTGQVQLHGPSLTKLAMMCVMHTEEQK
jgi:hypothetical protein